MRLKINACLLLAVMASSLCANVLGSSGHMAKMLLPLTAELECVLDDATNTEFFEGPVDGPTLLKANTAYFLPRTTERRTGVEVVDVLTNRVIKVSGDLTPFANDRFENFFDYPNNPSDYQVFVGYNAAYQSIIEPLTGEAGQWPYYDNTDTWIYVGNSAHQIETGDYLNFFKTGTNQFNATTLPKVTQQMVDESATISVQLVCNAGNDIQLRRNAEAELDPSSLPG